MQKFNSPLLLALLILAGTGISSCSHEPLMTAAEQQDVYAQYSMASKYKKGEGGVEQDYAKAIEWYTKAATQGSAGAQNNLGVMYQRGEGVARDYVQAYAWFKQAADADNIEAQHNLADLYRRGDGVPQDFSKAVFWYTKAAMQGDIEAKNKLSEMYYEGQGVARDYQKAYIWATLAATHDHKEASKRRDRAAALLTLDELTAAQKESTALFETIELNEAQKK